ncbi:hypothetical protein PGT21_023334 [Puccinia graminis f. sp. tritici]|uniref:Uncharacterized protein n=1 Tax=Puccinia graminis f. sp. tritici TaxID=56615 RepID=A0A5B0NAZ8_PUCGR|nr:hypothetical protein PGT21_023334 [Puccinia graminis f. sp. tritici]KAA1113743.1 hypothetical protein PGTUg99_009730 [Puccinia graminis f. sp. tritici]
MTIIRPRDEGGHIRRGVDGYVAWPAQTAEPSLPRPATTSQQQTPISEGKMFFNHSSTRPIRVDNGYALHS